MRYLAVVHRDPGAYLRHGDYEQIGDGPAIRLVIPGTDHRGHPIAQTGWGNCPRCQVMTTLFHCSRRGCDGTRTSRAHERECPAQPQSSAS